MNSRKLHGMAFLPGLFALSALLGCKGGGGGGGDGGGSSSASGGNAPVAVLSAAPRSGVAPLGVDFDASSSRDPEGAMLSFWWDFGNGQSSTHSAATVTYTTPGVYTVTLRVIDPSGQSDQVETAVLVDDSTGGESFAHAVVHLTNLERRAQGLSPLREEERLASAALGHAQDMALEDYFAHDSLDGRSPWDRLHDAGYVFQSAAENIAAGYATPEDVVAAWMASPGHRANILNAGLRELGVGHYEEDGDVFPGPYGYRHYWVQDFGTQNGVYPVVIDDEAYSTADHSVSLFIYGQGWATQMEVSEDPAFTGAAWQAFASALTWQLSTESGLKRVHVRLRGPGGALADAFDDIVLE